MAVAFHASVEPGRMALASPNGNRTYAELNARVNQLARALRARGLRSGDAVALICANRPEFAEVTEAAHRSGMRVTPVNWHLTGEEAAYIVADCEAKALIADARFGEQVSAGSAAPDVRLAVAGSIDGFESYEDAVGSEPSHDIEDPELGRTMLYTSGTTGRPKGVHRPPIDPSNPTSIVARYRALWRYQPGHDVHLCTGPLYHAAPLAFSLAIPLLSGVGVVIMDGWDPLEALRLIQAHHVTHTHLVPTMFHRLLALPPDVKRRHDVSSLRFVLHGAAPCPVEVKQGMMDWWGEVIFEYYAATEGGGTFITPAEWLKRPGSVGRPGPSQVLEVRDELGNQLPPDSVGTIWIKAPDAGRFEYWRDRDKTASTYSGDFFTLGDMGYFDGDGYLFLTDRSADLIISGGVNIYPAEVDAVLLGHPSVSDAATIGVPNEEWGEEVKGVIELKDGIDPSDELAGELIAYCRERLAGYKCPRTVDFTDHLPRHDTGKIYKRLLRDEYRQRMAP
jgi:long-chain acyl-CoA synthetase